MIKMDEINNQRVWINVGGTSFQCFANTLKTIPKSRLSTLTTDSCHYDAIRNEFFFDRNPLVFSFILDACRTGSLHLPRDVCGHTIKEEMEFWQVSPALISECCWRAYYQTDGEVEVIKTLTENYFQNRKQCRDSSRRMKLWLFLDNYKSSQLATIWGTTVMVAVLLSTVFTLTESIDALRQPVSAENQRLLQDVKDFMGLTNSTDKDMRKFETSPLPLIVYMDATCYILITVDIVLRLVSCPSLKNYLSSALNVIEGICAVDFWLTFAFERNLSGYSGQGFVVFYFILKALIILKVFRLFRLCRYVSALQVLSLSIRSSKKEMVVVSSILLILVVLFGALVYSVEFLLNDNFNDVTDAMYWALITLTTVGYGDIYPTTAIGQFIACACAVCGMLMLALPVSVIASSFNTLYGHHLYAEKHVMLYQIEEFGVGKKKTKHKLCSPWKTK